MGKRTTSRAKVTYPAGLPTPSVESQYQVSWLVQKEWSLESELRVSKGRKALVKILRGIKTDNTFRVRKVA